MRRTLTVAALALSALVAFPAAARADSGRPRWSFGFGFGSNGPYFQGGFRVGQEDRCRPARRHVHVRAPIYKQVWVPPVYDRVVVGYTECGRPIHRTVMVRCGYYDTVIVGYRCSECRSDC